MSANPRQFPVIYKNVRRALFAVPLRAHVRHRADETLTVWPVSTAAAIRRTGKSGRE